MIVTLKRFNMFYDILRLLNDGVISLDDLKDFSQGFQDEIKAVVRS